MMTLVVILAVSYSQVEGAEVMELQDNAAVNNNLRISSSDEVGLRLLDAYIAANLKQREAESDMHSAAINRKPTEKGVSYSAVPGYKYTYLSRMVENKSRASCENVCNSYTACKSFSYNEETRTCIWSMSAIKYNPNFNLFAKNEPTDNTSKEYSELPGMLIQDKIEKPNAEVSFAECKYGCSKDVTCKVFSYSEVRSECLWSSIALHYTEGYTYYEKASIPAFAMSFDNEQAEKDEMQTKWVRASTVSTRDGIEKEEKQTVSLTKYEAEAIIQEKNTKHVQAKFTSAAQRCTVTGMNVEVATTNNLRLGQKLQLAGVAQSEKTKMSENLVKVEAQSRDKEFEVVSKASIAASLGKDALKESVDKYRIIEDAENAEKKRITAQTEHKEKYCAQQDLIKIELGTEQIKLKKLQLRAADVKAVMEEMTVVKKLKNAKVEEDNLYALERDAKAQLEKLKREEELINKKNADASSEIDSKKALDLQESVRIKLKNSEETEQKAEDKYMSGKETVVKLQSQQENSAEKVQKDTEAAKKADEMAINREKGAKAAAAKREQDAVDAEKAAAAASKENDSKAANREAMRIQQIKETRDQVNVEEQKKEADKAKALAAGADLLAIQKKLAVAAAAKELMISTALKNENAEKQDSKSDAKALMATQETLAKRVIADEAAAAEVKRLKLLMKQQTDAMPLQANQLAVMQMQSTLEVTRAALKENEVKSNNARVSRGEATNDIKARECVTICEKEVNRIADEKTSKFEAKMKTEAMDRVKTKGSKKRKRSRYNPFRRNSKNNSRVLLEVQEAKKRTFAFEGCECISS